MQTRNQSLKYKTPNRRRLKKWIKRTERMIERARARGFAWFIGEVIAHKPMQDAANRLGVDLSARYRGLPDVPPEVLRESLLTWILGKNRGGEPLFVDWLDDIGTMRDVVPPSDEFPSRSNLEI